MVWAVVDPVLGGDAGGVARRGAGGGAGGTEAW